MLAEASPGAAGVLKKSTYYPFRIHVTDKLPSICFLWHPLLLWLDKFTCSPGTPSTWYKTSGFSGKQWRKGAWDNDLRSQLHDAESNLLVVYKESVPKDGWMNRHFLRMAHHCADLYHWHCPLSHPDHDGSSTFQSDFFQHPPLH